MNRYESKIDINAEDSHGKILRQVRPCSVVLEFGPATGCMTRYMREAMNCDVYIVEIDPEAYAEAMQWAKAGICGNIEDGLWAETFSEIKFDHILFADVLEHLSDPQSVLDKARTLLSEEGTLIASVPNLAYAGVLAELCQNSFQYRETGLLDRTHIHFFAYNSLVEMFENAKLHIIQYDAVKMPLMGSEFRENALRLTARQIDFLRSKSLAEVYQFVFTAVKDECRKRDEEIEDRLSVSEEINRLYVDDGHFAKAYFDCGEGLSEQNCVKFGIDCGRSFQQRILLPKGCRALRLDPVYGTGCLLLNLQARTETTLLPPLSHNGLQLNEILIFKTTTPQIYFDNIPIGSKTLTISAEIVLITENAAAWMADEIERMAAERLEARASEASLNRSLADTESRFRQLHEDSERFLAERAEELQAAQMELRKQEERIQQQNTLLQAAQSEIRSRDTAIQERDTIIRERDDALKSIQRESEYTRIHLEADIQARDASLAETRVRIKDREATLALFGEQLRQKDEALLAAENCQAEKDARIRQLTEELAQVNAAFQTIAGSASWRITAPMRKALDKAKTISGIRIADKGIRYLKKHGPVETVKKARLYFRNRRRIVIPPVEYYASFQEMVKRLSQMERTMQGVRLYLPKVLKRYDEQQEKKVLLVTHELTLTGAPMAIRYFALCLKELGYCPVVISPSDGKLAAISAAEGVPVIVYPALYQGESARSFAKLFNLFVVNTIVSAPIIQALNGLDVPILWWIHEAHASYQPEFIASMPRLLPSNVSVYAGGAYAKGILEEYRPDYAVRELLYYIPDFSGERRNPPGCLSASAKGKRLFVMVGTLEYRKGYHILTEAILRLTKEEREACFFLFVGRQCYPPSYESVQAVCTRFPENAAYIEELAPEKLRDVYAQMDCLICASLDDPMPIVVVDSLILSKPVICSAHTGCAPLLREIGGAVYENDDPDALAACIRDYLNDPEKAQAAGRAGRMIYDRRFSYDVYKENVQAAFEQITREDAHGSLSMTAFVKSFNQSKREDDRADLLETLEDTECGKGKKRILLVSHELSLTGAPIVLLHLAKSLKKAGAEPVLLSPFDGELFKEFTAAGIPAMVYGALYEDGFLAENAPKFDMIVLNTVVTYRAVNQLADASTPVVWWIHDSAASYTVGGFGQCMPQKLPSNTTVFCGGEYAREQLLKYYPNYSAQILYYSAPDLAETSLTYPKYDMGREPGKKAFAVIGLQDMRKGHDIFAKAIDLLSDEERSKAQFYFIGKHLDRPIQEAVDALCAKYPENVKYIEQVSRQELFSVYRQIDCVVCSSRDDPLPVFVTEAMMMSKLIICSEHTGSAPILRKEKCGLIYRDDDPAQLAVRICEVLDDRKKLSGMRKRARSAYLQYFSEDALAQRVGEVLSECSYRFAEDEYRGTVSVVIPTYNAGGQMEELLRRLRGQKGVRAVEIIAVDSGSTDGTREICARGGAACVAIDHQQFSHSYARNLGALRAHGEILLFMTQDALPSAEDWLSRMIRPIAHGEAVAVSCRERCPEGTDMYYRAGAFNHANYLGIRDKDRLNAVGKDGNGEHADALRPLAALNDVACAIDRRIFTRFLYRFDYAEDLDLGIRLLRSGYAIKLLGSLQVVHGHNRPAEYYLKRGYVEARSLGNIFEGWKPAEEDENRVCRKLMYGARTIESALLKTSGEFSEPCEREAFINRLLSNIEEAAALCREESAFPKGFVSGEETLERCLSLAAQFEGAPFEGDREMTDHVKYYLENVIRKYLQSDAAATMDAKAREEVFGCVKKQAALFAGNLLARLAVGTQMEARMKEWTRGV